MDVPLEPTLQLTLTVGSVRKIEVQGLKSRKKVRKKLSQDVVHPGLSVLRSPPEFGLGCFSSRQDRKLSEQAVNP